MASHVREDGFFLKWSPPENDGGSPVIDYVIKVSGSEKQTRFTSIFIKNLDKNTSYCTVCVQARNKVDKSKERCINVTTLDVGKQLFIVYKTLFGQISSNVNFNISCVFCKLYVIGHAVIVLIYRLEYLKMKFF